MSNTKIDKMKRIVRVVTRDDLQRVVILCGNVSLTCANLLGKLIGGNFYLSEAVPMRS